jgi:hypothetical protein
VNGAARGLLGRENDLQIRQKIGRKEALGRCDVCVLVCLFARLFLSLLVCLLLFFIALKKDNHKQMIIKNIHCSLFRFFVRV